MDGSHLPPPLALAGPGAGTASATFDDVDDYPWVVDSGVGMDHFSQVFDLVQQGNRAFRENRIDLAIDRFSKAHIIKPGDAIILGNRCAAFCRKSNALKSRSASASEYRPLNGLDPTSYAELALKDAEKISGRHPNIVKFHYLKANAQILLERYDEARETLLTGLHLDTLCVPLQDLLRGVERISPGRGGNTRPRRLVRTDDFECTLCFKLLYQPVTTPCGHSFCRTCIFQTMDHGNKCPMCRTVLFISFRSCAVSVTLNNIIQKNFPEEYAERKAEHENLTNMGSDLVPLFVMDIVLPCQKMSLNIFEPRYRLMVRRVMEGSHRMGMAAIDSATGSIADFACEVEITECEPLPDGRFYIEVEGRRRFRILQSRDQDGYRVAKVEWIKDNCPLEGTPEREELNDMAAGAAELAQTWLRQAQEAARTERRSRRTDFQNFEGASARQDPERFSFWLSNLLNLRPSDRLELLRLRDTRERISRGLISLRAEQEGCRVQ